MDPVKFNQISEAHDKQLLESDQKVTHLLGQGTDDLALLTAYHTSVEKQIATNKGITDKAMLTDDVDERHLLSRQI